MLALLRKASAGRPSCAEAPAGKILDLGEQALEFIQHQTSSI